MASLRFVLLNTMLCPPQRLRCAILIGALGLGLSLPCAAQSPPNSESAQLLESHLGNGYEALKQERYEVAAAEFQEALKQDPSLVLRARFPLAVCLFEMHKSLDARRELETVRRETGDHPNIQYYLGRLDLDDRNFAGAIRNLAKAAIKPPFPDTAYYLGFAYFKQGNLTAAEKWLKSAVVATPKDPRVQYQLGMLYKQQGKAKEARESLAASERLRRGDAEESRLKTECSQKLEQGLKQEAHAICQQLYDPNDPKKLTALGTAYAQYGDLQAALDPLQRAAALDPQSPQMQYNLALVYFQLNQLEEARKPLARALERWPDLFQLNFLYGAVLAKSGDDQDAYKALVRARKLNPQDKGTEDLLFMVMLANAEKNIHNRENAAGLRYLKEAAQLKPIEPEPHRRMADIYSQTNQPDLALAERQEAKRLEEAIDRPK
jgi:tetratricopeptide (TPR) repeat protein